MKDLKTRITENGIDYVLVGDYYIPDLKLPEEKRSIGKWGRMHREYLKKQCYGRYSSLLLTGKLWSYLEDLDEQAEERFTCIVDQMKAAEGVTEELKRKDAMLWVQRCNNIRNRAEEIVTERNGLYLVWSSQPKGWSVFLFFAFVPAVRPAIRRIRLLD